MWNEYRNNFSSGVVFTYFLKGDFVKWIFASVCVHANELCLSVVRLSVRTQWRPQVVFVKCSICKLCWWRHGLTRRARSSLGGFCVRGLDRPFDVCKVRSHLVKLWMQVGMQGITFRGLTRIRLPNHYSDNSSLVFVFTCFMCKKLCLIVAQCVWVWVCVQCECVDGNHCYLSYIAEHSAIWVLSLVVVMSTICSICQSVAFKLKTKNVNLSTPIFCGISFIEYSNATYAKYHVSR